MLAARPSALTLVVAVATLGCGAPSATAPPRTAPQPTPAPRVVAAPASHDAAPEVRIEPAGLSFDGERIADVVDGDVSAEARDPLDPRRIPELVDRIAAERTRMPPDEVGGSLERPLEPRFATIHLLVVRLVAQAETPYSAILRIVASAGAGHASIVEMRTTGEPPERGVPILLAQSASPPDDGLVTITGTNLWARPAGGELTRETRTADEPAGTTMERLLARAPALSTGPVVVAANPDVPAATVLAVARELRARGVPALYLSAGIE